MRFGWNVTLVAGEGRSRSVTSVPRSWSLGSAGGVQAVGPDVSFEAVAWQTLPLSARPGVCHADTGETHGVSGVEAPRKPTAKKWFSLV